MQTLEAALSLLVFASILSALYPLVEEQRGVDDSLYRLQLAEDAWRVLYLRDDFKDFGDGTRAELERDIDDIGRQTSLCVFQDGIRSTNCRGGHEGHGISVTMQRTVVCGGVPRQVVFSLGK